MTNEQALQNLYAGSRLAPLPAEQHELLRKCAEQIAQALKPKETKAE
jgi:D-alanine-D-alanine ligase-like ATP-grasp enzyme